MICPSCEVLMVMTRHNSQEVMGVVTETVLYVCEGCGYSKETKETHTCFGGGSESGECPFCKHTRDTIDGRDD
jgi:glutaredoxin